MKRNSQTLMPVTAALFLILFIFSTVSYLSASFASSPILDRQVLALPTAQPLHSPAVTSSAPTLTLTSPHKQDAGWFGYSVAISGSLAIIGAYNENASGTKIEGAGNAYVFNTTNGALIQTLTSPHAQKAGNFGWSVAISGNLAIVGAYDETAKKDFGAGRAYIFNVISGALIQTLTSPHATDDGYFGNSVAISGNLAIIGAPGEYAKKLVGAGNAYLFNVTTGALVSTLSSPKPKSDGSFGCSVALSGGLAIAGADGEPFKKDFGAGNAYIFNASTGALVTTLSSPNAQSNGGFGYSVGVSGKLAIVGAYNENASSTSIQGAGNAYVFNSNKGTLISTLTSPNAQDGGSFGNSVAINGNLVIVGADGEIAAGHGSAGHAYLFDASTGALTQIMISPHPQLSGNFGNSVALGGSLALVGAFDENVGAISAAGRAYVFAA